MDCRIDKKYNPHTYTLSHIDTLEYGYISEIEINGKAICICPEDAETDGYLDVWAEEFQIRNSMKL